jgi:hypothetical protein
MARQRPRPRRQTRRREGKESKLLLLLLLMISKRAEELGFLKYLYDDPLALALEDESVALVRSDREERREEREPNVRRGR